MCIFSFHLSDSFQELGISPNLGWIPSRPAGAEVPPRWQTLDGNKALSHRLALIHGSPVPTALAWCSHLPQELGQQHLNPQKLPSEVTSYQAVHWWSSGMRILRSGEGDRSKAICSKPNTTPTEKYKFEKKPPLYSRQQKLLVLQGGVCPWNGSNCYKERGFCIITYSSKFVWVWGFLAFCFLNLSRLPKGMPGTI